MADFGIVLAISDKGVLFYGGYLNDRNFLPSSGKSDEKKITKLEEPTIVPLDLPICQISLIETDAKAGVPILLTTYGDLMIWPCNTSLPVIVPTLGKFITRFACGDYRIT